MQRSSLKQQQLSQNVFLALNYLATLFFIIAERSKRIEIRKSVLANMADFNPWMAFKMLSDSESGNKLGYLSASSLHSYLVSNRVSDLSASQVQEFLDYVCKLEPGQMSYQ